MADNVTVLDPAGKAVQTANPETLQALRDAGAGQSITPEYAADLTKGAQQLQMADQAGPVATAGMGLASGLTLGLGPGLAAKAGLVNRDLLEGMQESGLYTAGDVVGMIAPTLLSGGEALAGRGLLGTAMRLTPAGLMEAGGSLAERLALKALPQEAGALGRVASTPLRMAARGAVEGALINMGHSAGDAMIQDKPLSAQSVAAAGVDGALFGGLAGGAVGGVAALGGRVADAVGGKVGGYGGRAEDIVYKSLGASEDTIANKSFTLSQARSVLQKGAGEGEEITFATGSKAKTAAAHRAGELYRQEMSSIADTLDKEAATSAPPLARIEGRLDQITAARAGTYAEQDTAKLVNSFKEKLGSLGRATEIPDKATFEYQQSLLPGSQRTSYASYVKQLQKEATEAPTTWKKLIESRQQLAEAVKSHPSPIAQEVLSALDSEIRAAMTDAGEKIGQSGLAEKFAANQTMARVADELSDSLGKKTAKEVLSAEPAITPRDLGAFAGMTAIGHPISGVGWLAAKGIGRIMQRRLEPAIAEMAYQASVGAKAQAATQQAKLNIASSVKKFFRQTTSAGRQGAQVSLYNAQKGAGSPRKQYEQAVDRTEQLLSANHRNRLEAYAQQLQEQGYGQFAGEMLNTYQRAQQYLQYNMPPRKGTLNTGSLKQPPVFKDLNQNEWKFLRLDKALKNPFSLLDNLEKGTVSRDEVMAVKYVYPEWHREIVSAAAQEIYQMKSEGKFMPVDKIAQLGIVLDSPIDSTLEPDFVNTVQAALNAPPANQPQQNPPTQQPFSQSVAETGLLTPLQQSLIG